MTLATCTVIDDHWVGLNPLSLVEGVSLPFSLYSDAGDDQPLLRGGQLLTPADYQNLDRSTLYFRRSMLAAYGRYLDGRSQQTLADDAVSLSALVESGRVGLLALFDEPSAADRLLASRRWAQRIVGRVAPFSWMQLMPLMPQSAAVAASSVRCALAISVLGRVSGWAERSQVELTWAALIHALGHTMSLSHSHQDDFQTLLPLITADGPISAQLYGALRSYRERRDGRGLRGLVGDEISLAAGHLGFIVCLEEADYLVRPLDELRTYLQDERDDLSLRFSQPVLEGINRALCEQASAIS